MTRPRRVVVVAGPSWWWLGRRVVDTRLCVPPLWPGARAAEWTAAPWQNKADAAAATQAEQKPTASAATDLDWRRLTGTWISNRMLHNAAVPGCAAERQWEHLAPDRSEERVAAEQRTVGGEAWRIRATGAPFRGRIVAKRPHFASHPAAGGSTLRL